MTTTSSAGGFRPHIQFPLLPTMQIDNNTYSCALRWAEREGADKPFYKAPSNVLQDKDATWFISSGTEGWSLWGGTREMDWLLTGKRRGTARYEQLDQAMLHAEAAELYCAAQGIFDTEALHIFVKHASASLFMPKIYNAPTPEEQPIGQMFDPQTGWHFDGVRWTLKARVIYVPEIKKGRIRIEYDARKTARYAIDSDHHPLPGFCEYVIETNADGHFKLLGHPECLEELDDAKAQIGVYDDSFQEMGHSARQEQRLVPDYLKWFQQDAHNTRGKHFALARAWPLLCVHGIGYLWWIAPTAQGRWCVHPPVPTLLPRFTAAQTYEEALTNTKLNLMRLATHSFATLAEAKKEAEKVDLALDALLPPWVKYLAHDARDDAQHDDPRLNEIHDEYQWDALMPTTNS